MLIWIEGNGFHKEELPDPCYTLHDVAAVAYPRFITHLWIAAHYGEFEPMGNSQEYGIAPYYSRLDEMMGATIFKRGHKKKDLDILFPHYSSWGDGTLSSWVEKADVQELLITIHYLEQKLGVPIGASAGRVGWEYLKKLEPEWTQPIGFNFKNTPFMEPIGDKAWSREMTMGEQKVLYLHKFDKSSAFTYAASRASIGRGVPIHVDHGQGAEPMGDKQEVGIWRCTVEYGPVNPQMPFIVESGEKKGHVLGAWLHGPTIQTLRSAGHQVAAHEGWVFPEKSRGVLDRWANNLWQFRIGFGLPGWRNQRCALFAQEAMKSIMNDMIGLTGFGDFTAGDEKARPDLRGQVIAKHKQLMWHNIEKMRNLYHVTPVAQQSDAVYYLSNEVDGRKAFPALCQREGQLGGYKYEGRVPMDAQISHAFNVKTALPPFEGTVRELINDKRYRWNYKLNALNTRGWEL